MFNADAELQKIKERIQLKKKKRFRASRLDKFRGEILSLNRAGASLVEISEFLAGRGVPAVPSTVSRYLKRGHL